MNESELLKTMERIPVIDHFIESYIGISPLKMNERFFREMIEHRIEHCEAQLKANLYRAKLFRSRIVWEDGYFTIPVWKMLKAALNQDILDWSSLVWVQIIKQMGRENKSFDSLLWDIAAEHTLNF